MNHLWMCILIVGYGQVGQTPVSVAADCWNCERGLGHAQNLNFIEVLWKQAG
jgi:hypothetical protein